MREVCILGVGQLPVERHSTASVREMGAASVRAALADAGMEGRDGAEGPGALYVGNMMSGMLSSQQQLGALIAHEAGLGGIEAATAEAACGSGAAALRWGYMAVASGAHEVVMVCGVERMTHVKGGEVTQALATASDWCDEGGQGETFVSLNAQLMRLYMDRHDVEASSFGPFAINAHNNSCGNPHALFHKTVTEETYEDARIIEEPVRLFDVSPICDGSAAVMLGTPEALRSLRGPSAPRVHLAASSVGTDSVGLKGRRDPLGLDAARRSAEQAYAQANLGPDDMDLFELHDAYTVMAALSLEAAGFAEPGEGYQLGLQGDILPDGRIPITTMGGLKGRGHPVGATGVYQLVEAYSQLCGNAGVNQIASPTHAMTQNFGGTAATVITHILTRAA